MPDTNETYVEIEFARQTKTGEEVCGDEFKVARMENENRYITVLSDGLGSGIKASLLANMTSSMAIKFISGNMEIMNSAEIIMDTLPVCEVRKISYATFTIVDAYASGPARVIEMGNPEFIHLRNGKDLHYDKKEMFSKNWPDRKLLVSEFKTFPEDRIIIFSDGVTQAGLGRPEHKFGWKRKGCLEFVQEQVAKRPDISARELSRMIVTQARLKNEDFKCVDDITCGVIYFRKPRRMLLLTGPPFHDKKDTEFATMLDNFKGRKVICGGTTANIISRELDRKIETNWKKRDRGLPPTSKMDGVDLITEGILTLTETASYLENDERPETASSVRDLVEMFHESDIINIVVGTKVNEAHQDPNLPVDLEIRRNIVKRIKNCLENKLLKKVNLQYI